MQPPPSGRTLRRRSPRFASTPPATKSSATAVKVPLADVPDQTLRRLLHEVEDALEAVRAAVVRVGNLALRRALGEVQEGAHHGVSPAQGGDFPEVLLVHGQDVIEVLAVLRRDEPRPLGAYVQPAEGGGAQRPVVGRGAHVPVPGPGGVHEDLASQALAPDDVLEDALRDRAAADVAHADEQYLYGHRNEYTGGDAGCQGTLRSAPQPGLAGAEGGLHAVGDAELAEDVRDVILDGL